MSAKTKTDWLGWQTVSCYLVTLLQVTLAKVQQYFRS